MNEIQRKILLLAIIPLLYLLFGVGVYFMVQEGRIERLPPSPVYTNGTDTEVPDFTRVETSLEAAKNYVNGELVRDDGHIYLYVSVDGEVLDNNTNSEAMSYYLLWNAQAGHKQAFDEALTFIEEYMLQPHFRYLMWRVNSSGGIEGDGSNMASDADLRAIKALLLAEEQWGDERYTLLINNIASALERMAVTQDGLLAPYAGVSGENSTWSADESWLSYEDFTVFNALAGRRGEPWISLYDNMKNVTLEAQIHNGLYNSQLTQNRDYGNGIDGGGYSINSMWMMVRGAESSDPELRESARESLAFYKNKYKIDGELYALYNSNGFALSPQDTPWAYALVGRAAAALGDEAFADEMMNELIEKQVLNGSSKLYGAMPEGGEQDLRVGQFTMQESILTLQEYLKMKEG